MEVVVWLAQALVVEVVFAYIPTWVSARSGDTAIQQYIFVVLKRTDMLAAN